jgi:hypothetical protein
MSRYTPDQLREHAIKELTAISGTPDPSDDVVLEIYTRLQEQFYPTRSGQESIRGRSVRDNAMMLRRGIETLYPWVRADRSVKDIQNRRKTATSVGLIPDFFTEGAGMVRLEGVQVSGGANMLRYEGLYASDAARRPYSPAEPAPLFVLLNHLLHIEKVVNDDTPVQMYQYDTRTRPGQALVVSRGSAMPLSQYLEDA